uniref:Uncharacterized protein n=1 Tax=Ixodes ricinus TaxID=34613 RepID=A0A6B0UH03_IXORI
MGRLLLCTKFLVVHTRTRPACLSAPGASGADVAPAWSPDQTLGTRRQSFPGPGRGTPGGHAVSSDDSMLEPSLSYLAHWSTMMRARSLMRS